MLLLFYCLRLCSILLVISTYFAAWFASLGLPTEWLPGSCCAVQFCFLAIFFRSCSSCIPGGSAGLFRADICIDNMGCQSVFLIACRPILLVREPRNVSSTCSVGNSYHPENKEQNNELYLMTPSLSNFSMLVLWMMFWKRTEVYFMIFVWSSGWHYQMSYLRHAVPNSLKLRSWDGTEANATTYPK